MSCDKYINSYGLSEQAVKARSRVILDKQIRTYLK